MKKMGTVLIWKNSKIFYTICIGCVLLVQLFLVSNTAYSQSLEEKNKFGKYEIDILLVFTARSLQNSIKLRNANSNGYSSTLSVSQVLENQAKVAFANSQINDIAFNVVGEFVTDYVIPDGMAKNDLTELVRDDNDGVMDDIHIARDKLNADVVVFLGPNGPTVPCGDVNFPPLLSVPKLGFEDVSVSNEKYAFAVVHVLCAFDASRYSALHEIGHLMHARHTEEVGTRVNQPFTYNYGFESAEQGGFRTIMGNNNGVTKIPYWSNPSVRYNGTLTGVPEGKAGAADVAKTLSSTAQVVASYRLKNQKKQP